MDLTTLRKKLSTYRAGQSGRITKVPDELAYEVLLAWESWPGPAMPFYKELGVSQNKMARLLGRAKRLKRDGAFVDSQFKEVKVEQPTTSLGSGGGIVLRWEKGRVIKFSEVDQLVDFLKKVA